MPIDAIKQPAWSKERQREYNREYRAKHAEELAAKAKLAYAEKKIRLGIRDVRGPVPKVRNRHVYIARARSRRTHLEQATPAWIDMSAVAKIYKQAAEQGMHVDHIIPLKGKTVCGLHVETNLQLLTPKENLSKGNRYAD